MVRYIVAGIGTDVGKTIASAILSTIFEGNYWKPIECGGSDSKTVQLLLAPEKQRIFQSAYSFVHPVSPHEAAALVGTAICLENIIVPKSNIPLIIETAGGVFTPLATYITNMDLLQHLNSPIILVSRHYLGSINHTLLTVDALKKRALPIAGIIFNGNPYPATEQVILERAQIPLLGRILPEPIINASIITRYASAWKQMCLNYLH